MPTAKAALQTGLLSLLLSLVVIAGCFMARPIDARMISVNIDMPVDSFTNNTPNRHRQVACLASAIYYESRGEPLNARIGVAQVTLNRAKSKHYPDTICNVVYSGNANGHCAYSWVCQPHSIKELDSWYKALDLANKMYVDYYLIKSIPDHTHGALYFVSNGASPSWMNDLHATMKSGSMVFLADRG